MAKRSWLRWRSHLWRDVVQTPTDFGGFDRRFVYRGLYLEALEGESVKVFVAVDTSGSIGAEQLRSFLGEVQGIVAAYPHLQGKLYYEDAEVYGPYPLNTDEPLPKGERRLYRFLKDLSRIKIGRGIAFVCI